MDLQTLVDEYASVGLGKHLYQEVFRVVRAVVARGYPTAYSPTGQWDAEAIAELAHDWLAQKLLKDGQIDHLLLSNQSLGGFRRGLELFFTRFLISQKQRTALDNLFQRTNVILESDERFRLLGGDSKKAERLWGLATWAPTMPYQGSEEQLIAIGLRLRGFRTIRYKAEARKLSPIMPSRDLAELLLALLDTVEGPLTLAQMLRVFRYRFNLLEADVASLDAPVAADEEGSTLTLGETIHAELDVEDGAVIEESAATVLREMSARQHRVLLEYVQPDATLESVAERLGYSKSTVHNDLRRTMAAIGHQTADLDEARATYDRLLELLDQGSAVQGPTDRV